MAIDSYTNLKTAFGNWMYDRSDLTSFYDDAIDNFESRVNFGVGLTSQFPSDPIRVRDMVASTDITLSSGAGSLPADFLEVIKITAKESVRKQLTYAAPDWIEEAYPTTSTNTPTFYTILGSSLLVRPVTSSDIELYYYQKVPALSDSQTTNWLLADSPNCYLYGGLFELSLFIGDTERAISMYTLMAGHLNGLIRTQQNAFSGVAAMRAAGPTP